MVGRQSSLTALFSRQNAARQRVESPVEEEDRALELIGSDEEAGEEERESRGWRVEGVSDDGWDEGCEVRGATADGGGGGGEDGGGCVGGARKKTLREFMAPRQAEQQGTLPRAASNLCRALMSSETGGRMSPAAQTNAFGIARDAYYELPTVPGSHTFQHHTRPLSEHNAVWGTNTSPPHGRHTSRLKLGYVAAIEFDAVGELLACVSTCGTLAVLDFLNLRWASKEALAAGHDSTTLCTPLVKLQTERRLAMVRWSKANQNHVACVSAGDKTVALYDLEYCGRKPTRTFEVQGSGNAGWAGNVGLRGATGLSDLKFLSPERSLGYAFATAGAAGVVALWDQRTSGRYQTTTLTAAARSRALHCLEVVDGGRRVLAGTDAGEIVGWDLRGGRSGGQIFGGGGAYSHPLTLCIPLDAMVRSISGASVQGDTPTFRGPVHSISADPLNERRLGFSLASGTSGVYHSSLQHLTHVFSPASQPAGGGGPEIGAMEAYRASVRGKRRGAWWGAGRGFVLESPYTGELLMLDFGPGTSSSSSHGGVRLSERSAARIPMRLGAVCSVGVNPRTDEIVAGGTEGALCVMHQQPPPLP